MGRKFYEVSVKYNFWSDLLSYHFETIILLILVFFFIPNEIKGYYFLIFAIYIIYLISSIIIKSKKAKSTNLSIYDDKLVYEMNFIKPIKEEIFYNEMKDLRYTQKQISNLFNIGDLIIVKKQGEFLKKRRTIRSINNYKEVIQKLEETILEYGKKNNLIKEENIEKNKKEK